MSGEHEATPERLGNGDATMAGGSNDAPPVAAVFLIKFDLKVGYMIAWKRALNGVELDGVVEYKCLPSGLHNVKEDLVYFVHDDYAGVSAFINGPASEQERNAHLVAVGVLVPLTQGRLGRSWLHATRLQSLAASLVSDITATAPLEELWETYQIREHDTNGAKDAGASARSPDLSSRPKPPVVEQPSGLKRRRRRALSTLTNLKSTENHLPENHPVLSILRVLEVFGPLLYPLYRAALLRKRIVVLTAAPVRFAAEMVYDLSILSSIPGPVADQLPQESEYLSRIRPLFTVGVHDIPMLEKASQKPNYTDEPVENEDWAEYGNGFIACTTDEILATKSTLYDIVVELPHESAPPSPQKRWPKIKDSSGTELKATQRDLRRYRTLKTAIRDVAQLATIQYSSQILPNGQGSEATEDTEGIDEDRAHLLSPPKPDPADDGRTSNEDEKVVEPTTWTALAYSSFMWWASAGEVDAATAAEQEQDEELLSDLFEPTFFSTGSGEAAACTGVIAYFHRLTTSLVRNMAEVAGADDEREWEEDAEGEARVVVETEDLRNMGLDVWSEADAEFAKSMMRAYFGREAEVHGAGLEMCGIRMC